MGRCVPNTWAHGLWLKETVAVFFREAMHWDGEDRTEDMANSSRSRLETLLFHMCAPGVTSLDKIMLKTLSSQFGAPVGSTLNIQSMVRFPSASMHDRYLILSDNSSTFTCSALETIHLHQIFCFDTFLLQKRFHLDWKFYKDIDKRALF